MSQGNLEVGDEDMLSAFDSVLLIAELKTAVISIISQSSGQTIESVTESVNSYMARRSIV